MDIVTLNSEWSGTVAAGKGSATAIGFCMQNRHMIDKQLVRRGVKHKAVLQAMRDVPRHLFVPLAERERAYDDSALPIGHKQTISQPYIVAFMTEILQPKGSDSVLEIGTGSGYQAAVLSRLVKNVYSVEIVEPLAEQAARTLAELGYDNVHVKHGDGNQGWPEHAPYDAVIVTCAAGQIPQTLVDQLDERGRMIIPVGATWEAQELILLEKHAGTLSRKRVLPVRFVPMTGGDTK